MTTAATGTENTAKPRYFGERSLPQRLLMSQAPFATSVLLVFIACLWLDPQRVARDPVFILAVLFVGLLTLLTRLIPWDRFPGPTYWVIPLLDFVAVAPIWSFARYSLDGTILLAVFPVFWLAWSGFYPRLALALGFLGCAGAVWWPYLTGLGDVDVSGAVLLRPALFPFFALFVGLAASTLMNSMDRQRIEAEAATVATRKQARLLETVLDTTDVGILVIDAGGHDRIMNAAQRRIHQAALPEGMTDGAEKDLVQYEMDRKTPIPIEQRAAVRAIAGEDFHGRLFVVGNPPRQRTLSVSAQGIPGEDGERDGSVLVFQDVTELMDAIEARERFLADISHEFRTPLTSIIGYLDLARDEDLDPVVERYLTTISRNAERLLTLVQGLLDAASGNRELSLRRADLAQLARHAVESASVRAKSDGVELKTDAAGYVRVVVDPVKMAQVIDNLVSNGIKYTQEGGRVSVAVRGEGDWAELSVTDNGRGMTADQAAKVFEGFYRTEDVRRAAIPGTGLGLAITQSLVRDHGGEITVESEPGAGSTFTVRIPVAGPTKR